MSEEQDQVTKARKETSKKILLVTFPLKIAWGIVKLMFWVLLIYLLVYFLIWGVGGFDYAYSLLQKNYDYLAIRIDDQSAHSFLMTGFHGLSQLIQTTSLHIMDWLGGVSHNQAVTSSVDSALMPYRTFGLDGSSQSVIAAGAGFVSHIVSIIAMALLISLMKLVTSMSLVSMYGIGIVLGILTGNRKRLYRRLGVDRESDTKHKIVKFLVGYSPLLVIALYMVLPFNFNPLFVFFVIGVISVVLFYLMVSTFKKYL